MKDRNTNRENRSDVGSDRGGVGDLRSEEKGDVCRDSRKGREVWSLRGSDRERDREKDRERDREKEK